MIIFRYLSRELTNAVCGITGLLLLIFLSNQFVRFLSKAASGKYGGAMALKLIAIETPHLLGILLPLGLFLSILFVYGRMYADNEMTVLNACGFSRAKLTAFTLPFTAGVMIITSLLAFWISPQLIAHRDKLLAQTGTAMELETTIPGRFQAADGGQKVFYVESMSVDRQHMHNIFMAELDKKNDDPNIAPWIILTAQGGYQMVDPKTGDRFFVATQGRRYGGTPGHKNFQIASFDEYGVRMESHVGDLAAQEDALPTRDLWHATKNKLFAASEIQWRISSPLSVLLLALLAIPLSRVNPRHGKYSQLFPAILVYIIYANLLMVGRSWIEQGSIPPYIGLWWIHICLFILIGFIWLYQTGWQTILAQYKKS